MDKKPAGSRRLAEIEAERIFTDGIVAEIARLVPFRSEQERGQFSQQLRRYAAWIIGRRQQPDQLTPARCKAALEELARRIEEVDQTLQAAEDAYLDLDLSLQVELALERGAGGLGSDLARVSSLFQRTGLREHAAAVRRLAGDPRYARYARNPDRRRDDVRALARLWFEMTGTAPKRAYNGKEYGPSLEFVRTVLSRITPDPGELTGLFRSIWSEFRQEVQESIHLPDGGSRN